MKKLYFFFIFFFSTSAVKTEEIHLSFDHLFPVSLFEQVVNTTMKVWHRLKHEKNVENNKTAAMMYDHLLGQLVFAQFCLKRMYLDDQAVCDEDARYLHTILDELKMSIMTRTSNAMHQRIACVVNVVEKMQRLLTPIQQFPD